MSISVHDVRIQRLDNEGHPMGDPVALSATDFIYADADGPAGEALCVAFPKLETITLSMTIEAVDARLLRAMLGPSYANRWRRWMRYRRRSHGHAPKRRNKHGRTGVRR